MNVLKVLTDDAIFFNCIYRFVKYKYIVDSNTNHEDEQLKQLNSHEPPIKKRKLNVSTSVNSNFDMSVNHIINGLNELNNFKIENQRLKKEINSLKIVNIKQRDEIQSLKNKKNEYKNLVQEVKEKYNTLGTNMVNLMSEFKPIKHDLL